MKNQKPLGKIPTKNRTISIMLLIMIFNTNSFANGNKGEYGCYGSGVIAFGEASEGNTGLYIILLGESGISKKFRIELPRQYDLSSDGIKCDRDKVLILTTDNPTIQTREIRKSLKHLTEISLKDRKNPKVASDKPNHYAIWRNSTEFRTEPVNDHTPIIRFPEPNLNFSRPCMTHNDPKHEIVLEYDGPKYTYHLLFDATGGKSTVRNSVGSIFHRCKTFLLMRDENGQVMQRIQIADIETQETVD